MRRRAQAWALLAFLFLGCGGKASSPTIPRDAGALRDAADAASIAPDGSPGAGPVGAPCASDTQCNGLLCLGGPFAGGYCSTPVEECDPGSTCGDGGLCKKTGGVDIDGAPTAEYCLQSCRGSRDCRTGYACCAAQEYRFIDASVCAPPSFCPDE